MNPWSDKDKSNRELLHLIKISFRFLELISSNKKNSLKKVEKHGEKSLENKETENTKVEQN